MKKPELIVMLTKHDLTVHNAFDIFDACKDTEANIWGIKEKGISEDEMKRLFEAFRRQGKTGVLEVVAYTEEEGIRGAELAAECGCDILLGTLFSDSVNALCQKQKIKYMPFVGQVSGRPSVLEGDVSEMLSFAKQALAKGAYGFDLLSYRYKGDSGRLSQAFVSQIGAPVCVAGSIDSYERLDRILEVSPAYFTIGGAFFENRFGDGFAEQIRRVCRYIK
ncbi:MAG: hypothetical protein IJD10_04655 [Clostridia bacterium]|nr:hypothetical protein [Clostridia bacterium]